MADVPQIGPGHGRGDPPSRVLASALVNAGIAAAGLLFGIGALVARLATGHGVDLVTLLLLYAATVIFLKGFTALALRRVVLNSFTLLLFAAGVFGVLFLLGYLLIAVIGPVLISGAQGAVGFINLADLAFYFFALMTIGGAAGCAFSTNIIYSAWSLLFAFLGVAGLYIFLGADFPAVAQVLIYVGGILVLILFAIMLTKQIGEDPKLTNAHLALPAGALLGAAAVATLSYMAVMAPWKLVEHPKYDSTAQALGIAFLTDYLLPFEVASVVLLAALIGSVVIARKEIKETSDEVY